MCGEAPSSMKSVVTSFAQAEYCCIQFAFVAVFWFMIFLACAGHCCGQSYDTRPFRCLRLELYIEIVRRFLIHH